MAGTIDHLNFEVLLHDANFRTQIENDIALADKLNTHLSDALNFKKHITTTPLATYRREMDKVVTASKSAAAAQGEFGRRVDAVNSRLNGSAKLLRNLSTLTGGAFSVIGLRRFLSTLVDVTGQFEVQKMALRNMLQDIDGADKIFQDLYNFSSQSTYRFSELAKYAKQLAAFNIDQNNLLETTKMLGDVASGVGVSMDRLILAYGHVKSSGFLRGIQLRSFSQNGVPILEELSKMFTEIEGKAVSLGDVFDRMTKRQIGFEMVEEAFRRMTSEGGKFYQMQEVLAKTLAGQINILKGKWENLMYAMGESQEGVLKGIVGSLTKIVSSTENFGRALASTLAILGAYRLGILLNIAATEGWAVATNTGLIASLKGLGRFLATNPWAAMGAAVAAATVLVVKYAREIDEVGKSQKALADAKADWTKQLGAEISELETLYSRLQMAEKGTEEYAAAKGALESRFGPYISQLRAEGVEVNNLTLLYDGLKKKVEESAYARFSAAANKSLDEVHAETIGQVLNGGGRNPYTAERLARALKLDERSVAALHQVVLGQKTYEEVLRSGLAPGFINAIENGSIEAGRGVQMSARQYLDYVTDRVRKATDAWETGRKAVEDYGVTIAQFTSPSAPGSAEENLVKISSIVEAIKSADRDIAALRSKAAREGITESEEEQLKQLVSAREDDAKRFKEIMGVDYDKQVKATQTAEDKATKERIQNLKAEISVLEKYADAREKLEPFFGSETDSQLAKIFGEGKDYSTLDSQILALCESLRQLGDEGVEAAEQIETRLGLDQVSSIVKAQKALQKWQTTLRKWMQDWGGGDLHGIEYDIDKVIREYNNEDSEITNDYLDSLNEIMEAHWGDAAAIEANVAALDKLVAARRAANGTAAQEKLNDLADKYVKEKTKGLNLRDWGDKSIGQIRQLYRTLQELAAGEVVIDETVRGRLESAGLKIEDFADLAKQNFEELSENARQELQKKLGDTLKEIVSDLGGMVEVLGELSDMSGNAGLSAFADAVTNILPVVESTLGRLAQGDYIGAVVGWLAQIATGFFRARQESLEFEAAIRSARESSRRAGFTDMLGGGVDSIFGTNEMAKVNSALSVINKARTSMNSRAGMGSFSVKRGFWDWFVGQGGLSDFRYMQFSLSELAESVGRDLYDSYGNLNAETLQVILNTYENLGQAEKEWIQGAINDSEAYAEAMEQLDDVMESLFGKVAADAASQIVDQWAEAGDAALDYADILDDVARSYAKMITQSMLIESVLTPQFKERLAGFFQAGDTENAMALILGGMEQMQAMAPAIAGALEPLRPYIQAGSSGTDTLKDGISKELVEGNSSLIASYLNAMRADLSVIRGFQASGWQDIRLVRESMPTFLDYAAQVAANTYDNAQATQAILSRLQSIITPSTTGGNAVRTTK